MSSLLIIGAGGHGRVVADAALTMSAWSSLAFVDDKATGKMLGCDIAGDLSRLSKLRLHFEDAVVAIGNASVRLELVERCKQLGFRLPPIIHKTASVSSFATLGAGTVVMAQAAINAGSVVGQSCIVNTGATIDHDCVLADGIHVCPGAHLAGDVKVGAKSWIGIGACIRNGVSIGREVTVGAGAAVICDIEDGLVVVGVPARPLTKAL